MTALFDGHAFCVQVKEMFRSYRASTCFLEWRQGYRWSYSVPRKCPEYVAGARPSGLLVQNVFTIAPFSPWGDFPALDPIPLMAKPTLLLEPAAVPVIRISTLFGRDGVLPPFAFCHGRVRLRRDPFADVLLRSLRGAANCGYPPA